MYLTYDEYLEFGGTLDETTFLIHYYDAEAYVDWYTFGRVRKLDTVPPQVKRLLFKLIMLLHEQDELQRMSTGTGLTSGVHTAGVASQSNDGVSVSYNVISAADVLKNGKDDISNMIRFYLQGVRDDKGRSLFYRGLYPNE